MPSDKRRRLEETLNSVTHGIGAGLSLVGLILLVCTAIENRDVYQIVSFSIYGSALTLLYLASSLYHGSKNPRIRRIFKKMDHASIFILIASSYTPFLLVAIRGRRAWFMLVTIWLMALLGVGFKTFFIHRLQKLSVSFYIIMGWLSLVLIREAFKSIPPGGLIWIAAGGAAYTVGVIFYALSSRPYMHVVWHIFVMVGSLCHFMAVLLYLAPMR